MTAADTPNPTVTRSPEQSPRPDAERLDHARVLLAEKFGEDRAAWLLVRWARALALLTEGSSARAAVTMAALTDHIDVAADRGAATQEDVDALRDVLAAVRDVRRGGGAAPRRR